MGGRTHGDRIDELTKVVAALVERVDNLRNNVERNDAAQSDAGREIASLKTSVALLQQELAELRKSQDKWGQRLWMVLAPLIAAIVGTVIGVLLKN